MNRYCFNWSLVGSTIIEAETLEDARRRWDAIESNVAILESADAVDYAEEQVLVESEPGCYEEVA